MKTNALLSRGAMFLSLIVGCMLLAQPAYSQKFKKFKQGYPEVVWWKITYPNGKVGFSVNEKKNIVADETRGYTSAEYYIHGLFIVGKGGYQGLVDMHGNEVVAPNQYNHIEYKYGSNYSYWQVGIGSSRYNLEKLGALSPNGKMILPCKYKYISSNSELVSVKSSMKHLPYFVASSNDSIVVCDTAGVVLFSTSEFSSVSPYITDSPTSFDLSANIIAYEVYSNGKYGVCDKDGHLMLPPVYESIWDVSDEFGTLLVRIKENDKMGIIDIAGNEVVPFVYDYINLRKGKDLNYFEVELNKKKGVCDENGLEIIPPIYDGIVYIDGKFCNFVNGRYGAIIDVSQYANPEEKITLVNGKYVLSYKGKTFSLHPYDELVWVKEKNRYYASLDGYSTYVDLTGKEDNSIAKRVFDEAYAMSIDKFEEKLMLYNRAIELDSNNREGYKSMALNNIGVMYAELGDENTALAYYDKSAQLGNSYGRNNAQSIRDARVAAQRAERSQRISNALTKISNSLSTISSTFQQNSNSNYNSSSGNNSSSGSSKTHHSRNCTKCAGSGSCAKCGGDGYVLGKISQEFEPCSSCNFRGRTPKSKQGKCTYCNGTGKK